MISSTVFLCPWSFDNEITFRCHYILCLPLLQSTKKQLIPGRSRPNAISIVLQINIRPHHSQMALREIEVTGIWNYQSQKTQTHFLQTTDIFRSILYVILCNRWASISKQQPQTVSKITIVTWSYNPDIKKRPVYCWQQCVDSKRSYFDRIF